MSLTLKVYLGLFGLFVLSGLLGLDTFKRIAAWGILILTVYYATLFVRKLLRKFLWRIRRKLILSYIFIGFIPLMLLASIFVLAFWIFMGQATTEMFNSALDSYVLQTKIQGKKLLYLTHASDSGRALEIWSQDLTPDDSEWIGMSRVTLYSPAGPQHLQGKGPDQLPDWLAQQDFVGLVFRDSRLWLASSQRHRASGDVLYMEVPVSAQLLDQIGKRIGANITYAQSSKGVRDEFDETMGRRAREPIWPKWWDVPVAWISLPEQYSWQSGERIALSSQLLEDESDESAPEKKPKVSVEGSTGEGDADGGVVIRKGGHDVRLGAFAITTNVSRIYDHIFSRSTMLQKFVYALMMGIAVFFLLIELVSFIFGFLLARSITASVHNLAEGTERIKRGDLTYRVRVGAKDQLGDLASQFNSMTDSIQKLLVERAEKERLAEGLQIARQMQQNLLPRSIQAPGGMEMAAMNLPAEEVCGDYYDILRKNENETGIIIADVSGKGPSAALYMAEVKGVMLSMSRSTAEPRGILVEANRILAPTLDSRNFITMTCAVIHEKERRITLSRAGHNPVLQYCATTGRIEVLQPKGIGLGMGKNGMFESSLEEMQRDLCPGDIFVFYTDGLTEAMNEQNQLYGMDRLSNLLLKKESGSAEMIKTAILQDLQQFLNGRPPQDDVTLVLLKIL